jgi:hypothetical protein
MAQELMIDVHRNEISIRPWNLPQDDVSEKRGTLGASFSVA